jgi:hypothetical protein
MQAIIERFSALGEIGVKDILNKIPISERRYKCHTCHLIVDATPCPNCGESHLVIMCPLDHCHCGHDLITSHAYCPLCGEAVCPECGTHDVVAISRVTGLGAKLCAYPH